MRIDAKLSRPLLHHSIELVRTEGATVAESQMKIEQQYPELFAQLNDKQRRAVVQSRSPPVARGLGAHPRGL